MADQVIAPDEPARQRIECDLATTLFVEAGAGSGKTTALVKRVFALVMSGVELRHIAAITFTEKAAAELRDRIREALERAAAEAADPAARHRGQVALDQLDSAAIGTLHAFAQRVLSEHPVEAGLPPRVEVLDEVASGVEFERRWRAFRDELFADRAMERTLLLLLASGVDEAALRGLAQTFGDNWDLVAERVPDHAPEPPDARTLLAPVRAELAAICAERSQCREADDRMVERLEQIEAHIERLATLGDEVDLVEALHPEAIPKPPSFAVKNCGRKG